MSINDHPCEKCTHFDRVILGNDTKGTRHGWCAVRSTYPHKEQQGQSFPHGVMRAEEGALAAPVIVMITDVVPHCTKFTPR